MVSKAGTALLVYHSSLTNLVLRGIDEHRSSHSLTEGPRPAVLLAAFALTQTATDTMAYVDTAALTAIGILFPIFTIASVVLRGVAWRQQRRNIEIDDVLIIPAAVSSTQKCLEAKKTP